MEMASILSYNKNQSKTARALPVLVFYFIMHHGGALSYQNVMDIKKQCLGIHFDLKLELYSLKGENVSYRILRCIAILHSI